MRFEWDEEKNRTNILKHGFDFSDAWEIFESEMLTDLEDREDYGEDRWIGVGVFRNRVMVVAYTDPDDDLAPVITVRKATKYQREAYEKKIFENRPPAY